MKKLLVLGIMVVLGTMAAAKDEEFHVKIKDGRQYEATQLIVKGHIYDVERVVMNNITGSDTYRVDGEAFYAIEAADEFFIYDNANQGKVIIPDDDKLVSKY